MTGIGLALATLGDRDGETGMAVPMVIALVIGEPTDTRRPESSVLAGVTGIALPVEAVATGAAYSSWSVSGGTSASTIGRPEPTGIALTFGTAAGMIVTGLGGAVGCSVGIGLAPTTLGARVGLTGIGLRLRSSSGSG